MLGDELVDYGPGVSGRTSGTKGRVQPNDTFGKPFPRWLWVGEQSPLRLLTRDSSEDHDATDRQWFPIIAAPGPAITQGFGP